MPPYGDERKRRKQTARFVDIARESGTSIATVDRVLNERGHIAPETAQRVIDAARRLGANRVLPGRYHAGIRFNILLARPHDAFYQRLSDAFAQVAVNIRDHRLTTRTVRLNPLLRFLYWNMNYHIEHHLYPTVPFHALPQLHLAVEDRLPRPSVGLWGAWREILPALWRQQRDPDYCVMPVLPGARTAN